MHLQNVKLKKEKRNKTSAGASVKVADYMLKITTSVRLRQRRSF